MKRLSIALVLFVLMASFIGCVSMSSEAQAANIQLVTASEMVQGLQFVKAWTGSAGTAWSPNEFGVMIINKLAENGYRDLTILVEYQYTLGKTNYYKVSIYK
jgi:hypothetical protein